MLRRLGEIACLEHLGHPRHRTRPIAVGIAPGAVSSGGALFPRGVYSLAVAYVTIEWNTVEVTAAEGEVFGMAVHLEGSPDESWRRAFNALAEDFVNSDASKHPGADWTIAPVGDEYVRVDRVRPGQESAVKDELKLLVERANAETSSPQQDQTDAAHRAAEADAMARRFRGA